MKNVFEDLVGLAKTLLDVTPLVTKMKTDIAVIVDNVAAASAITRVLAVIEAVMRRSPGDNSRTDSEHRLARE